MKNDGKELVPLKGTGFSPYVEGKKVRGLSR